jgi:hypothetical protein
MLTMPLTVEKEGKGVRKRCQREKVSKAKGEAKGG